MRTEHWQKDGGIPPISEVIQTFEIHCQNCGNRYRFIVPEKIMDHEEMAKYYQKLSEHYHEKWIHAQQVIRKLTEHQ